MNGKKKKKSVDVLIIGGGHAGCEAYAAACRIGASVVLITASKKNVGYQPCNPAVGGPGKGHLVREITALGGLMGSVTDKSGLQFRTLNKRRGPAVRATRVQTDSKVYSETMLKTLCGITGGKIVEDSVESIKIKTTGSKHAVEGVYLLSGKEINARTIVVATGTFLRGMLFTGDKKTPGGRAGAAPAVSLANCLRDLKLPIIRLKTGTCPRIDGLTINIKNLEAQKGDSPPPFFDPTTKDVSLPQLTCYLTYSNHKVHEIVRRNINKSALMSGAISGIGPRYCPSFETKVDRFAHKERHQIFLEPEDSFSRVVYPSGISTSLPPDVQEEMVHAIPGLEECRIVRYGYAVEYDAVEPSVCKPSLEVDGIDGLFLAGQILGTSGYEEAGAAGLTAGANAALIARGDNPIVLERDMAYTGVMIDDLTGKGIDEPYRMFTSRSEYRLILREDNADERLYKIGMEKGLISARRGNAVKAILEEANLAKEKLSKEKLTPSSSVLRKLSNLGLPRIKKPLTVLQLLSRHGVGFLQINKLVPWTIELSAKAQTRIEVDVKYAGYLENQRSQAERLKIIDRVNIPQNLNLKKIPGLRTEIIEKLLALRPSNLGQAGRIPGITPAAIQILHVYIERFRKKEKKGNS